MKTVKLSDIYHAGHDPSEANERCNNSTSNPVAAVYDRRILLQPPPIAAPAVFFHGSDPPRHAGFIPPSGAMHQSRPCRYAMREHHAVF
jgi:hypothetical protein